MFTGMDVLTQEERRRERLAQAEHHRLLKELARPGTVRLSYRLLVYVGQRLEQWGCRLQARYEPLTLKPIQAEPMLSGPQTGDCTT